MLNIFNYLDYTAFRLVLLSVHQVKWDFIQILALASNHLSVLSPQSPSEGCGVIPVEGRSMCIDPDPGGPTLNRLANYFVRALPHARKEHFYVLQG